MVIICRTKLDVRKALRMVKKGQETFISIPPSLERYTDLVLQALNNKAEKPNIH